jgi:hypothetical protein
MLLDLRHLAALDREAAAKMRLYGRLLTILGFIWIPMVFVSCGTGLAATRIGLFSGLVAGIFFGWYLFIWWKRSQQVALALPDYRYQVATRLIEMLRWDTDDYGQHQVQISFALPRKPARSERHPYRLGWNIDFYEDPWLQMEGKFLDGTHYSLNLCEKWQIRHGRNINGNLRSKPRNKGLEIKLVLQCDRRLYGDFSQALPQLGKCIKLPPMTTVKSLHINGQRIKIRVVIPSWQAQKSQGTFLAKLSEGEEATTRALGRAVTMTFLSGYQFLNYARHLIKPHFF